VTDVARKIWRESNTELFVSNAELQIQIARVVFTAWTPGGGGHSVLFAPCGLVSASIDVTAILIKSLGE